MTRIVASAAVTLLAVVAAGCGGGGGKSTGTHSAVAPGTSTRCATHQAVVTRALAKVNRDIARIRRAAVTVPATDAENGNAAVNKATDAFLLDVDKAPITNLQRNRLIDHAAAALVSACHLCFGAMEADRPIITMKFYGVGCSA